MELGSDRFDRYKAIFGAILVECVMSGVFVDSNITVYVASYYYQNDKNATLDFFFEY